MREIMDSIIGGHAGIGQRYETLSSRDLSQGSYSVLDNFNDPTQFGVFDPTKQAYGVGYLPYNTAVALSLESLEDIAKGQEQTYLMMQEQQAILNKLGGVSRAHAENMKEFLPPNLVMESFTGSVTKTNYLMVQEALSTGMRLVAAAGIIALLGGVVYILHRIASKEPKRVNKDRAMRAIEGAHQTAVVVKAMDKPINGLTMKDNPSRVATKTIEQLFKDGGVSIMGLRMYTQTYKPLSSSGNAYLKTAKAIDSFLRTGVLANIDNILRKGEAATVSDLKQIKGTIDFAIGKAMESWASANGMSNLKAHDALDFKEAVTYNLYPTANEEDIHKAVGQAKLVNSATPDSLFPETEQVHIDEARELMGKLSETVNQVGKSVEDAKLPAEVSSQIKEDVGTCKEIVKVMDLAFDIHDNEVAVYNRITTLMGQSVGATFGALKDNLNESADITATKAYNAFLKQSFEDIRDKRASHAGRKVSMQEVLNMSEDEFNTLMADPDVQMTW